MYVTIKVKDSTANALRSACLPGEGLDAVVQRLLGLAGHAVARVDRPRVPRETKYHALETCLVGQTMRLPWRGLKNPQTGAFWDTKQAAVYMAVLRCERRTGFQFQRHDDGVGLRVTRIR